MAMEHKTPLKMTHGYSMCPSTAMTTPPSSLVVLLPTMTVWVLGRGRDTTSTSHGIRCAPDETDLKYILSEDVTAGHSYTDRIGRIGHILYCHCQDGSSYSPAHVFVYGTFDIFSGRLLLYTKSHLSNIESRVLNLRLV